MSDYAKTMTTEALRGIKAEVGAELSERDVIADVEAMLNKKPLDTWKAMRVSDAELEEMKHEYAK